MASATAGPLMVRPGVGQKGRPLTITTNAFAINKQPQFIVHHYDVIVKPEVPTRINRQVFAFVANQGTFGTIKPVYDGQKNCYSPAKLGAPFVNDAHTVNIFLPEDDAGGGASNKKQREGRQFEVTFRKVAEVNLYELGEVMKGKRMTENCFQAITTLNVMIRHLPSLNHLSKAASIYPAPIPGQGEPGFRISGAVELWRGFYSSIRPAPGRLIVNIDATASPMIQAGNLVHVASAHLRLARPQLLMSLTDRQRVQLTRFLRGVKVIVNRNDPRNPRMHYKIKDISREGAHQMKFRDDNGREYTVEKYFRDVHNVPLTGSHFPCVKVTQKAWYPMELCTVAPGNKFTKKLDPDQIAEALKFTTNTPAERKALIQTGLKTLGYGQNPFCNAWSFAISPQPLEIKARTLDPPRLQAKDQNGKLTTFRPTAGVFDFRSKRFFSAAPPVKNWGVIIFEDPSRFNNNQGLDTLRELCKACNALGLRLSMDPLPKVTRRSSHEEDVRGAFMALKDQFPKGQEPQLVICFITQKNAQYGLIKRFGDTGAGVATQCLNLSKLRKMNLQYFSNVALKINVKLKGVNVAIDPLDLPGFERHPTMVMGADVTHPGPGSVAPSIASVVGSWDRGATQYQAQTDIQSSREEIIQNLDAMTTALLRGYESKTKKKPTRIIFYRDGVSEGQYSHVYDKEVKAIRTACEAYKCTPGITYIICAKRHHFRFFPKNPADGDRSTNAKAGTVVDTDIIHPVDNDFYLQSHAGLLGTSRPTHYDVLLDDNKLGADGVQSLTYALCYAYARCTRSVSIVAPVYFAHHCATRARFHLGTAADDALEASTNLSNKSSSEIGRARDTRAAEVRLMSRPIHNNLKDTLYFL